MRRSVGSWLAASVLTVALYACAGSTAGPGAATLAPAPPPPAPTASLALPTAPAATVAPLSTATSPSATLPPNALMAATAAPVRTVIASDNRGPLLAVLESSNLGIVPRHTAIAIAGLDAHAVAKATFLARQVPFNSNAAAVLQLEAHVAGGGVYYADGKGVVRLLTPSGTSREVATFPITQQQQELAFAVSPDGERLVASIVTLPGPGPTPVGGGITNFEQKPLHLTIQSASVGGPTTTIRSEDHSQQQVFGAQGSGMLNVTGWDGTGPVATVDMIMGTQNPLGGRHWVGHAAHLDGQGRPGPILGGADCFMLGELRDGTVLCENKQFTGAVSVRQTDGVELWSLPAPPPNSFRGWFALALDGRRVALSEGGHGVIYASDGSTMILPTNFYPEGWLDAQTVVGALQPADATPAELAYVRLDAPSKAEDLGFKGTFVGAVPTKVG